MKTRFMEGGFVETRFVGRGVVKARFMERGFVSARFVERGFVKRGMEGGFEEKTGAFGEKVVHGGGGGVEGVLTVGVGVQVRGDVERECGVSIGGKG